MSKSAYDRWLRFIAQPYSVSGLTFPVHEARAIMAISLKRREPNWRRTKRTINKVAAAARAESRELLRRTQLAP